MKNKRIKITESQLVSLINKTIKNVLNEQVKTGYDYTDDMAKSTFKPKSNEPIGPPTQAQVTAQMKPPVKIDTPTPTPTPTQKPQAKTGDDILNNKGNVYMGMRNDLVGKIQEMLKFLGYKVNPDKKFGNETYNAVIAFQKAISLKPDGIVGIKTYPLLVKFYNNKLQTTDDSPESLANNNPTTSVANNNLNPANDATTNLTDYYNQPSTQTSNMNLGKTIFDQNLGKNLNYRDDKTKKTLVWKGKSIDKNDLIDLNNYLKNNGYQYIRGNERGKHIWRK